MARALCLSFLKERPGLSPAVQALARMQLGCQNEIRDAGGWQPARPGRSVLDSMFLPPLSRALPFRAQRSQPHAVRTAKISRVKAVLAGEVLVQHRQVHGAPRYAQEGMDVTDPESS